MSAGGTLVPNHQQPHRKGRCRIYGGRRGQRYIGSTPQIPHDRGACGGEEENPTHTRSHLVEDKDETNGPQKDLSPGGHTRTEGIYRGLCQVLGQRGHYERMGNPAKGPGTTGEGRLERGLLSGEGRQAGRHSQTHVVQVLSQLQAHKARQPCSSQRS